MEDDKSSRVVVVIVDGGGDLWWHLNGRPAADLRWSQSLWDSTSIVDEVNAGQLIETDNDC